MKVNLSFLKLVIRIIILLILFVVLFLISAFLYSARYWPDIYNYVNANITITRIPTLSELNLTIIEVEFVTEMYSTTDIDYSDSTDGYDTTEDAFSFDEFDFPKTRVRRNAKVEEMGSGEQPKKTVLVDYFFDDGATRMIKDLVDESKLTTRGLKDVEIMSGESGVIDVHRMNIEGRKPSMNSALFPWVAAIFLKNDTKGSQFDYFCDGAILNHLTILTAARCVHNGNETYNGENFIVILGKTSLQASGDNEKILRVKTIKVHENFTIENGEGKNDLAVLILEESISFDEAVSPANLTSGDELNAEYGQATDDVTTAWSLGGDLTVIYFDKEKSKACGTDNKVENTLCATYGDDVPLCPSYGGLIVTTRGEKLYLTGIRTGNPLKRGLCFSKDVTYTALQNYTKWISDVIEIKYD